MKTNRATSSRLSRCPKCGGMIIYGGVRSGQVDPNLGACAKCGFCSEQLTFSLALYDTRRPVGGMP